LNFDTISYIIYSMKTKLKLLALLSALSINAGAAEQAANSLQGELGFGYTSDYYFRGERISGESTQIKAKASTDVSIADAFVCAFANQGLQSVDSYIFAVGLADSYLDGSVDAKIGWLHRENTPGDANSEIFASVGLGVLLNPTITISQDLDDSLTTGEISVSHVLDVSVADLCLHGNAGNTETLAGSTSYYGAGAKLSREFGGLLANVGVDYVDAQDIDSETVFSAGVSIRF
jgi:hypothetical protein